MALSAGRVSAAYGCVPWALAHSQAAPSEAGRFQTKPPDSRVHLGSTFRQSHLGHDRRCLLWTEPSGTMEQRPMSASAEPPWEDMASKTLLLPLYGIILGSALSDTAEPRARLGPNLFYTFSMTLCPPWGCPAASSAGYRQDLGQGLSDTSRGPRGGEGARMARSGGAPRRCPEGRAFIPGVASRELPFGSARAGAGGGAGLRRAALQPGPGRGRWMPRLRWCCLPGRLRRSVSAGRRGQPPAGPGGAARRARAGKAGGRAGGGARRLPLPPCPLKAAARTPGSVSGPSGAGGAWRPRVGAIGRGGEGELRPPLPAGGVGRAGGGEARQGGFPFGGDLGLGGAPVALSCGVEAAASAAGASRNQAQVPQTDRPTEALEGGREGEHLRRALYPSQRPSPFHCQADSGLLSKEQLPDSWLNNGDPASPGPLPLGPKMGAAGCRGSFGD